MADRDASASIAALLQGVEDEQAARPTACTCEHARFFYIYIHHIRNRETNKTPHQLAAHGGAGRAGARGGSSRHSHRYT